LWHRRIQRKRRRTTGTDNAWIEAVARTRLEPQAEDASIASGRPAGLGVAVGAIAFDAVTAQQMALEQPVVLVRPEISPDDIAGLAAATGILTVLGGPTSHAAVVARQMNKVCIVGCHALRIDAAARRCAIGNRTFLEGDVITIDGETGRIYGGRVPVVTEKPREALAAIARW
jgi:pyruvate,orthophosphate dikinase